MFSSPFHHSGNAFYSSKVRKCKRLWTFSASATTSNSLTVIDKKIEFFRRAYALLCWPVFLNKLFLLTWKIVQTIRKSRKKIIFFFSLFKALCKRTLNIVEAVSANHSDKIRFYLSKADEAGHESDRWEIIYQRRKFHSVKITVFYCHYFFAKIPSN